MTIAETITETVNSIPEWSLNTLKSGNDAVLAATKKVVEAMEPMTHRIPSSPLAERLPSLPQPSEVLSQWFSYVEKLIAEQKRFGLDLAGAMASATPASAAPAPRKSAAHKADSTAHKAA